MITDPFDRVTRIDPVRGDEPDWEVLDHVLLATIDERTPMTIQMTPDARERRPDGEHPRHRGPIVAVLAIAASLVVVVAALLLVRPNDDPVPADDPPPPEEPEDGAQPVESPEAVAERFAATVGTGELDAVLGMLSAESDCDHPFSPEPETCEEAWGFNLAIGTTLEVEQCDDSVPSTCVLNIRSDLHREMGSPDYTLPIWIYIEDEDTIISDWSRIPFDKSWFPDIDAAPRLWGHLAELRPDISVNPVMGAGRWDAETGAAVMLAAADLTDPARVAESFTAELEEQIRPGLHPTECVSPFGQYDCREFFNFLYTLDAEIVAECAAPAEETVTCDVTIATDLHRALQSEPTTTEMALTQRAGAVERMEFDLRFSDDTVTESGFLEHAATIDGTHTSDGIPDYSRDSAEAWLEAATSFPGS